MNPAVGDPRDACFAFHVEAEAMRPSARVPIQFDVKVRILPEPVTVIPRLVSEDVAMVRVAPVSVCPAGPMAVIAVLRNVLASIASEIAPFAIPSATFEPPI